MDNINNGDTPEINTELLEQDMSEQTQIRIES